MEPFLSTCHSFATLRGFKHFETSIRGREEITVTVKSAPTTQFAELDARNEWRPASPCCREIVPQEEGRVRFLVAAYVKYKRPLVWLRGHHEKMMQKREAKDSPVYLNCLTENRTNGQGIEQDNSVRIWHIIQELVQLLTGLENAFEIDWPLLDAMNDEERVLYTSGLISFFASSAENEFNSQDLKKLISMHYSSFAELIKKNKSRV